MFVIYLNGLSGHSSVLKVLPDTCKVGKYFLFLLCLLKIGILQVGLITWQAPRSQVMWFPLGFVTVRGILGWRTGMLWLSRFPKTGTSTIQASPIVHLSSGWSQPMQNPAERLIFCRTVSIAIKLVPIQQDLQMRMHSFSRPQAAAARDPRACAGSLGGGQGVVDHLHLDSIHGPGRPCAPRCPPAGFARQAKCPVYTNKTVFGWRKRRRFPQLH